MSHHRRARPTLRVLLEDLTSDWDSAQPRRWLDQGAFRELHPFSELPHPLLAKATESFGADPAADHYVGPIASATTLRLLEIRQSQWRGAVWQDGATGVCWLVAAGLAKGGHQDRDDFYQRVKRANASGELRSWLPTEDDIRLLKQETSARILTEWELRIQQSIRDGLDSVHDGGSCRLVIDHPLADRHALAHLDLSVTTVREDDYRADEVQLDVVPGASYAGSNLLWQLTIRVLISIHPPEQGWDRHQNTYSNIAEPGAWAGRVTQLDQLIASGTLAESVPGSTSHFSHRQHLAGSTVEGNAVRALCGAFFVPTQDHEALPTCPTCHARYAEMPA